MDGESWNPSSLGIRRFNLTNTPLSCRCFQCLSRGFQICAPPFLARLQVASFSPFIPSVYEHKIFSWTIRLESSEHRCQPIFVECGGGADEYTSRVRPSRRVVPHRGNTRKFFVGWLWLCQSTRYKRLVSVNVVPPESAQSEPVQDAPQKEVAQTRAWKKLAVRLKLYSRI